MADATSRRSTCDMPRLLDRAAEPFGRCTMPAGVEKTHHWNMAGITPDENKAVGSPIRLSQPFVQPTHKAVFNVDPQELLALAEGVVQASLDGAAMDIKIIDAQYEEDECEVLDVDLVPNKPMEVPLVDDDAEEDEDELLDVSLMPIEYTEMALVDDETQEYDDEVLVFDLMPASYRETALVDDEAQEDPEEAAVFDLMPTVYKEMALVDDQTHEDHEADLVFDLMPRQHVEVEVEDDKAEDEEDDVKVNMLPVSAGLKLDEEVTDDEELDHETLVLPSSMQSAEAAIQHSKMNLDFGDCNDDIREDDDDLPDVTARCEALLQAASEPLQEWVVDYISEVFDTAFAIATDDAHIIMPSCMAVGDDDIDCDTAVEVAGDSEDWVADMNFVSGLLDSIQVAEPVEEDFLEEQSDLAVLQVAQRLVHTMHMKVREEETKKVPEKKEEAVHTAPRGVDKLFPTVARRTVETPPAATSGAVADKTSSRFSRHVVMPVPTFHVPTKASSSVSQVPTKASASAKAAAETWQVPMVRNKRRVIGAASRMRSSSRTSKPAVGPITFSLDMDDDYTDGNDNGGSTARESSLARGYDALGVEFHSLHDADDFATSGAASKYFSSWAAPGMSYVAAGRAADAVWAASGRAPRAQQRSSSTTALHTQSALAMDLGLTSGSPRQQNAKPSRSTSVGAIKVSKPSPCGVDFNRQLRPIAGRSSTSFTLTRRMVR